MITRETRQLFARLHMGSTSSEEIVDWAVTLLEGGLDSPNLRILASLNLVKPLEPTEVNDYFSRTLRDSQITFPAAEECLRSYMVDLAADILAGRREPIAGCRAIYQVVRALDYPADLRQWDFLDDWLDPDDYRQLSRSEIKERIVQEARRLAAEGTVPRRPHV